MRVCSAKYKKVDGKQSFYELKNKGDMHSVNGLIVCFDDFNGHVCRHVDGIQGVYAVCQRDLEVLLQFCLLKEFSVSHA